VKKGGKIYLAWDLAKRLSRTYTLKDERVWCLPPKEKVWTERGLVPIGEIEVGDRVLAHTGQLEPVTQVMRRNYEGVLVQVQPALLGGTVRLTPEHEVLVLKRREYHHADGEHFFEPFERSYARGAKWIPAYEVSEGDAVAFPVSMEEQNTDCISTVDYLADPDGWLDADGWLETRGRGKYGRGRLPKVLRLDEPFLRLAGWYLSEGSCGESGVCIANYEPKVRREIQELLKTVFDANSTDDGRGVWCRSRSVGQVLSALFGRISHEKHFPSIFFHLPVVTSRAFVFALARRWSCWHRQRHL
jgi:hypothetical protein